MEQMFLKNTGSWKHIFAITAESEELSLKISFVWKKWRTEGIHYINICEKGGSQDSI